MKGSAGGLEEDVQAGGGGDGSDMMSTEKENTEDED
jgi:hypothetical protein